MKAVYAIDLLRPGSCLATTAWYPHEISQHCVFATHRADQLLERWHSAIAVRVVDTRDGREIYSRTR